MPEPDAPGPRAPLNYETPESARPMTPAERRRFEQNLAFIRRIVFTIGLACLCFGAGHGLERGRGSDAGGWMCFGGILVGLTAPLRSAREK